MAGAAIDLRWNDVAPLTGLGGQDHAFRGCEYRTQLYVVHGPDGTAAADAVDRARLVGPEVALL